MQPFVDSSKAIRLALDSLHEFLLEDMVGRVKRDGEPLTTGGRHRQRLYITATNNINSYGNWSCTVERNIHQGEQEATNN